MIKEKIERQDCIILMITSINQKINVFLSFFYKKDLIKNKKYYLH